MPREILISGEIYLYGATGIDFFEDGFTALDVVNALAQVGRRKDVLVHLNSGGGYVHEGKAIYNAFKAHAGKITIRVEGTAASAASLLFMGADERIMTRGSLLMLHNPETFAIGDADEMDKAMRYLQADTDLMADIYAEHSGQALETVLEQMKDESWYKPEEALAKGYCDKIEKGAKAATATAFPYRQIYAHTPSNLLNLADERGWSRAQIRRPSDMATNPNPQTPTPQPDPPVSQPTPPPALDPQRPPQPNPNDERAAMAAIAGACATAGVPMLTESLLRSGATLEQAQARIAVAQQIRSEVDMARKSMASTLDPRLADQLIAGGSSLEHARAEIFSAVAAIQRANPTHTAFAPGTQPAGNSYSDEAGVAAWDKAVNAHNSRFTPGPSVYA